MQPNVNDCPACCKQNGLHPKFTGPPLVSQIQPFAVRVSWADIVERKMCANSFMVKYWKHDVPNNYKMTKATKADFVDIWFSLNTSYKFQVLANEDQDVVGIGNNWSPIATFTLGKTDSISGTTGNYNVS